MQSDGEAAAVVAQAEAAAGVSVPAGHPPEALSKPGFDVLVALDADAAARCRRLPGNPELLNWNLSGADAADAVADAATMERDVARIPTACRGPLMNSIRRFSRRCSLAMASYILGRFFMRPGRTIFHNGPHDYFLKLGT